MTYFEPLRFHGGEVIIGDIGCRDHQVFTALGDAVNGLRACGT
jgi:adenylate cyclase